MPTIVLTPDEYQEIGETDTLTHLQVRRAGEGMAKSCVELLVAVTEPAVTEDGTQLQVGETMYSAQLADLGDGTLWGKASSWTSSAKLFYLPA